MSVITFGSPCYLISGLGEGENVYVDIVSAQGSDSISKSILLSKTKFTKVEGLVSLVTIEGTTIATADVYLYGPAAAATIPSDSWGIVQYSTTTTGVNVALSNAGNDLSVAFSTSLLPLPRPGNTTSDTIDSLTTSGPGSVKLPPAPPALSVSINGGSVSNGIQNSLIQFSYTVTGRTTTLTSQVLPFGKASDVLTNATITSVTVSEPPTATPKTYTFIGDLTVADGMYAVIMARTTGSPVDILGLTIGPYYLEAMVAEGPLTGLDLSVNGEETKFCS
jgi:hypothetical protein